MLPKILSESQRVKGGMFSDNSSSRSSHEYNIDRNNGISMIDNVGTMTPKPSVGVPWEPMMTKFLWSRACSFLIASSFHGIVFLKVSQGFTTTVHRSPTAKWKINIFGCRICMSVINEETSWPCDRYDTPKKEDID